MLITSKDNETIKHIRKLKEKKYRDEYGEYVIEGIKLINDVVDEDANIIFGTTIDNNMGDDVFVTVIANGYKINMPKRAVEQFKTIRDDKDMLNAVLTGHLKLTDIKTMPTKSGITVSYKLTDC